MDNTPTTMDSPNDMVPGAAEPKEAQKHKRNFYTRRQLELLEAYFQQYRYLDGGLKAELATRTELSQLQVKNWFQNRRNRSKPKSKLQHQTLNLQPAFQPSSYPQLPSTPESLGTPQHMGQQSDLQQPFGQQFAPPYPHGSTILPDPRPSSQPQVMQGNAAYPQHPTSPATYAQVPSTPSTSGYARLPSTSGRSTNHCIPPQSATNPQQPSTFFDPTLYPQHPSPQERASSHSFQSNAANQDSSMAPYNQSSCMFSSCTCNKNNNMNANQDDGSQRLSTNQADFSTGVSTRELFGKWREQF